MNRIKKTTGKFKSFDGTEIYYEIRGEGPAIIMNYGIGCLINHWRYQLEYFSKDYMTVAFDIRGHHKSEIPFDRENLTIEAAGEDLILLADHLGIESFSGWGHSFGTQIMLAAYAHRPEMFNSMVFINGFSHNPFDDRIDVERILKFLIRFRMAYGIFPNALTKIWKAGINSPFSIPLSGLSGGFNLGLTPLHDIEIYGHGIQNLDLDVFARCFQQLVTWDGRRILPEISVPTLIVTGDKDMITPTKRQEFMHSEIKGSEFLRVPYGSHCTQLDLPELVNLRIEKFLA